MPSKQWILHVEPLAPAKPARGAPCNGCGVCCLVAPCPLGMLLSRRRQGACDALQWVPQDRVYRCGAVAGSLEVARQALPGPAQGLAAALARLLRRFAPRWIAAGQGCDSSLLADAPTIAPVPPPTAESPP